MLDKYNDDSCPISPSFNRSRRNAIAKRYRFTTPRSRITQTKKPPRQEVANFRRVSFRPVGRKPIGFPNRPKQL